MPGGGGSGRPCGLGGARPQQTRPARCPHGGATARGHRAAGPRAAPWTAWRAPAAAGADAQTADAADRLWSPDPPGSPIVRYFVVVVSPHTAGPRPALHRDRSPWVHRWPAPLGPAAAVPSPPALSGPWRWPLRGPPDLAPRQSPRLCPRHSALTPLPRALQRSHAPRRPAGAPRPPGLDSALAWPEPGPAPRTRRLHLPRPRGLQSGSVQPPPRGPQGSSRDLPIPFSLAGHAPAPPPATPGRVAAGASSLADPRAACTSAPAAFCTPARPSLRTPSGR